MGDCGACSQHGQSKDRDAGVTAIEYAIVAGLIAVVMVGSVAQLGTAVDAAFDEVQRFFAGL